MRQYRAWIDLLFNGAPGSLYEYGSIDESFRRVQPQAVDIDYH